MRSTANAMAEEKYDAKYSKREGAAAKAVLIFCSPPGSPESKVGAGYENQPFDLNHHDELTRVDHPPNSFAFRGSERRLSDPWTPGKSGGAGSLAWRTSGKNITHATSTLEGTPTPNGRRVVIFPPTVGKIFNYLRPSGGNSAVTNNIQKGTGFRSTKSNSNMIEVKSRTRRRST
jgi:hypothetical protein